MSSAVVARLKSMPDSDERCAVALDALERYKARQVVDAALDALRRCDLGEKARPILRAKALYYFEHHEADSGCHLREGLVRLLIQIANPGDLDVYLHGVAVHEMLMGVDVGQTLRAASLVGIAQCDPQMSLMYAVRLVHDLTDTSRFSGEPAITAIRLLAEADQRLPIYGFLLAHGLTAVPEVTSKALESLGSDFPPTLYRDLAAPYIQADRAVAQVGIVGYVIGERRAELYSLVEQIAADTRDLDLHRYAIIEMAAAHDEPLTDMLFTLAGRAVHPKITNYLEALEYSADPRRDALVAALRARKQRD